VSESIPETFKGKLGPLPVWAWGAIVGLVVVGYIWYSGRTDSGNSDGVATATDAVGGAADAAFDAIDGAFKPSASGSSLATDTPEESADSNVAWGMRAVQYLIGLGTAPITAQQAVTAYLNGDPMTSEQQALVNAAIGSVGQPPVTPELSKDTAASTAQYTKFWRDPSGQIFGTTSGGKNDPISDSDYIARGFPALASDQYQWRYTTLGKAVPLSSITSKFGITTERLIAMNNWKTIPVLKKGSKVKVPVTKGTVK